MAHLNLAPLTTSEVTRATCHTNHTAVHLLAEQVFVRPRAAAKQETGFGLEVRPGRPGRAEHSNNAGPHEWLGPVKIEVGVAERDRGCDVVNPVRLEHKFEPRCVTPIRQQSHDFASALLAINVDKFSRTGAIPSHPVPHLMEWSDRGLKFRVHDSSGGAALSTLTTNHHSQQSVRSQESSWFVSGV